MIRTVAFFALATFGVAFAQSKPPAPPPIWQQGKPAAMADSTLAPLAGKMTETPRSEIPVSKLKLPDGFKVEIWATGMPGGRAMARGDKRQDLRRHARPSAASTRSPTTATQRTSRVVVDKLDAAGRASRSRTARST